MNSDGSSSRTAVAGKTPSVIGTVTCLPVRSSMMVMVSGMLFPSLTQICSHGACSPTADLIVGLRRTHSRRSGTMLRQGVGPDGEGRAPGREQPKRSGGHSPPRCGCGWFFGGPQPTCAPAFVDQRLQRLGDHLSGFGGFDDGVKQAAI